MLVPKRAVVEDVNTNSFRVFVVDKENIARVRVVQLAARQNQPRARRFSPGSRKASGSPRRTSPTCTTAPSSRSPASNFARRSPAPGRPAAHSARGPGRPEERHAEACRSLRPPAGLRVDAHRRDRRHRRSLVHPARRRSLSAHRDAGRLGDHVESRGHAGEHREGDHRPHRSGGEHCRRHRRAAIDVDRRPVARHHHLRPVEEPRRRRAGSAGQGRSRHPQPARDRRPAGGAEAGSGLDAGHHVLALGADVRGRVHELSRAERPEAPRIGQRRRRGDPVRRQAPAGPGQDRSGSPERLRALHLGCRRGPARAEPRAAGRAPRTGRPGALGPHRRTPDAARGIPRHRRRHAQQHPDQDSRCRHRGGHWCRSDVGCHPQWQAGAFGRDPETERRQHGRPCRCRSRAHGGNHPDPAADLRGAPDPRRLGVHPRVSRRHRRTPDSRRLPRRRHRVRLPAQLPFDAHRRGGHPGVDHRRLRRHVGAELHRQPDDDARADADGRHRHRRRDRGAREHLPVRRREGHDAAARRGGGHQGNRPGGHGDDDVAAGGVPAGRLPRRDHRAVHVVVRADLGGGDCHQPDRLLHADADARVALDQARPRRAGERSFAARLLSAHRPRLHADAGVLDGAPMGDRRHLRPGHRVRCCRCSARRASTSRPRRTSRDSRSR